MTTPPSVENVFASQAQLGEGPVWIAEEKALYFVDILGKKVHRFKPETGAHDSWDAPSQAVFLLPTTRNTFLCGLERGLYGFDPQTGAFDHQATIEPERPGNRLNDACVDALGRVWFGTMDDGEEKPTGSIYCVRHTANGLGVTHHDEGYTVSNGPCVSPDGKTLYVADSPEQTIYAFDILPEGRLENERVFARLENGFPDGVVTDSAGNVWAAVWGGGRVCRFGPDGALQVEVPLPCTNVTKVALGGDDLKTVYVTTARKGLEPDVLAREMQAGDVFAFRTDIAGVPQSRFEFAE